MRLHRKVALVTGASSGIGDNISRALVVEGMTVIGCGRRQERLEALAELMRDESGTFIGIQCDLRDTNSIQSLFQQIRERYGGLDVLINNAGNAHGLDNSADASLDDWDLMIDTNLKGLMYVTKVILPRMISKGKGHIINVGSIAGKEVYPKGNVYCASKFGVNAFNTGLRIDLNKTGIKVGIINPGKVKTEFSNVRFKGDSLKAKKVYEGLKVLSAEDVANAIFYMANVPDHVNISDLEILPNSEANTYVVNRNL